MNPDPFDLSGEYPHDHKPGDRDFSPAGGGCLHIPRELIEADGGGGTAMIEAAMIDQGPESAAP